jgi:hypothetical protein
LQNNLEKKFLCDHSAKNGKNQCIGFTLSAKKWQNPILSQLYIVWVVSVWTWISGSNTQTHWSINQTSVTFINYLFLSLLPPRSFLSVHSSYFIFKLYRACNFICLSIFTTYLSLSVRVSVTFVCLSKDATPFPLILCSRWLGCVLCIVWCMFLCVLVKSESVCAWEREIVCESECIMVHVWDIKGLRRAGRLVGNSRPYKRCHSHTQKNRTPFWKKLWCHNIGKAESLCCNYILIDMKRLKAEYD